MSIDISANIYGGKEKQKNCYMKCSFASDVLGVQE